MSPKAKTVYRCTECGADHPKWEGRCDVCGAWNSLVEEVAVRAVAAARNRFAIGARVTIRGGSTKQVREIRSGGSFLSQNDLRAYFGLGDYAGPVDVEIRMPGGRRWAWKQLPTDRLHLLTLSDSASVPRAGITR